MAVMEGIAIGTTRKVDELYRELNKQLEACGKTESFRCVLEPFEKNAEGYRVLCLSGDMDPHKCHELHQAIAEAVSYWIVHDLEVILFQEYIEKEYYFFSPVEKETIIDKATLLINQREAGTKDFLVYRMNRQERIKCQLLKYLEDESLLLIDGFLVFRLREYHRQVVDAADNAVDEYIMEREYNKFVRLLKYLVEGQEPRVLEVHLFLKSGEQLTLCDEEGIPITLEGNRREWGGAEEQDLNYEDVVISALISLAPRQVYFHLWDQNQFTETIQTVKHVFGERVHFCNGCERCLATSQADS